MVKIERISMSYNITINDVKHHFFTKEDLMELKDELNKWDFEGRNEEV